MAFMNRIFEMAQGIPEGELKQRMYCLVLRQLNSIQKGVQAAHSIVEYIDAMDELDDNADALKHWMDEDKTLIMLDGGTCPDMKETMRLFDENNIQFAAFHEEDLNGLVTSIAVLASERVWNRERYPDYEGVVSGWNERSCQSDYESHNMEHLIGMGLTREELFLRSFLPNKHLAM